MFCFGLLRGWSRRPQTEKSGAGHFRRHRAALQQFDRKLGLPKDREQRFLVFERPFDFAVADAKRVAGRKAARQSEPLRANLLCEMFRELARGLLHRDPSRGLEEYRFEHAVAGHQVLLDVV